MSIIDRKIAAFSKKITDRPNRERNQGTNIKLYIETPSNELKTALNGVIDDISTDYASIAESKLDKTGNFTGTWGGESKSSIDSKIATATTNGQNALTQVIELANTVNQFEDRIETAETNSQTAVMKTTVLEGQFNQFIINEGNSNAEIVASRVKEDGTEFDSLPERLNAADSAFESHLSESTAKFDFLDQLRLKFAFGAYGDGIHDDTVALQNAINYAQDNNKYLFIPSGNFLYSTTLVISKRIKVFGAGMGVSRLVYSGTETALRIAPPTDKSSNTFYSFRDFGIEPKTIGSGNYGIEIFLGAGAYFSNFEFDKVYIGDFSNYGLRFNNDAMNVDGFFCGTIRRCWITNGINGSNIGDSITISENTITGRKCGILTTHLNGAKQFVIRENNITTQGGAIALINAEQPMIYNNQLEHPNYKGDYTGTYEGFVYLENVSQAEIRGNTINPLPEGIIGANYAILFDGTSVYNSLSKNTIAKGELYHIGFATNSVNNIVKYDNNYDNPSNIAILNTGVNNSGIIVELPALNSWVPYGSNTNIKIIKLDSGLITVSGALKDGTVTSGTVVATLPVGFRPKTPKRFQVSNFNGTVFSSATVLVDTNGSIMINQTGVSNTLLQLDGIQFTEY